MTSQNSFSEPLPAPEANLNRPGPTHRCWLCGRTYERADHLNRHLKSHENARPHKCTRCTKSFNRADLLNRHQASHDRAGSDKPATRIERGERVAAACLNCVASKAKCQDEKPCARCVKKGVPCETPNDRIQTAQRESPNSSTMTTFNASNQHSNNASLDNIGSPFLANILNGEQPNSTSDMHGTSSGTTVMVLDPALTNPAHEINNPNYYEQAQMASTEFMGYDDLSFLDPTLGHGFGFNPRDSYFSQDVDFGMWDIDLDSVELAYPSLDSTNTGSRESQPTSSISSSTPKDASKRYAAFERSPWLWKPTQKDQALNDQHNLDLDEDAIPSILTPESPAAAGTVAPSIHQKQRDQMLSLLLTLRQSHDQTPHFPSLSLLNSIIQVFFVQESFGVDSLIHTGSFDSAKVLPHLLIAIVSAGSTLISYPSIWKMGLSLQEVVRHTVAAYWEQDNRHTRDLQALQAFTIGLDVGLWSGFKRKMEIAESFAQPIIIMLRRAGAFAPVGNASLLVPSPNDSDAVLESKWRKWVERESFKRLVLHLFIHDTHASIGLQKPPLMSLTEIKFPLPCSRALWHASTAQDWRHLYLALPVKSTPNFLEALHSPDILSHFASQVDTHLTCLILLHGYWSQIYSLLESKKFYPPQKSTHLLCLHTQHTELYRDLSPLASIVPALSRNSPEATLIAELLQMILHVSPEDLQRFAGKFGEDEAKLASTEFGQWANTNEARIAVWHAGQVFRSASRLGQAQCRGFNAIAVYYASLTLWIYGLMIPNSLRPGSGSNGRDADQVVLNEAETQDTKIFRSTGQGSPGLIVGDGEGKFISLMETNQILAVARDTYRGNFPVTDRDEPLPPLVENLGNLLRDLGSLPGSRVSRAPSAAPE
ncbi:hypothetical protein BDZ45DRAFT_684227 [Acephala macrosclerotiorum]|nr:hypothetical protein BDZ45DRAFT_684227 [Acephala macrosclerotiorum]